VRKYVRTSLKCHDREWNTKMDGYKQQEKRGVQQNKSKINAFPKYLIECCDGALGQLHTSIYIPKCAIGPH